MLISVHPRVFDIEQARKDKQYGRYFTKGWQTVEVKRSAVFEQIVTTRVWSPIVFRDGHRHRDNFVESKLLSLDFDDPGYAMAEAMRSWCDTIHWIGTTKNHQRPKNGIICDRFRIIVPYAQTVTDHDLYTYNYEQNLDKYDTADRSTKDTARLFFPCTQIVSTCLDGEMQPVKDLPQDFLEKKAQMLARRQTNIAAGSVPRYLRKHFELPIEIGRRDNTIYGVSKDLCHYGFTFEQLREMFLASPTFSDRVLSPGVIKKLESTIENGLNAANRLRGKTSDGK